MTVEEYENMALMKSIVEENTSGIVESVTQFQKDAVIDEFMMLTAAFTSRSILCPHSQ